MAEPSCVPIIAADIAASSTPPRHAAFVRVSHWIGTLCFFALLVTGIELVISHPRFYWGETGNVLTPSLFDLPIPASRGAVKTGYGFVLPDQNGWSRSLHFQAGWLAAFASLLYLAFGLFTTHFRKDLLPARDDLSWRVLSSRIANHLRFKLPGQTEAWSYNVLQRLAYLGVIFVLLPLMLWTGLAMSPAFTSVFPATVTVFGGQQSARTIHFFVTVVLVLFVVVHIMMVYLAGFRNRMRAMITGHAEAHKEHQ